MSDLPLQILFRDLFRFIFVHWKSCYQINAKYSFCMFVYLFGCFFIFCFLFFFCFCVCVPLRVFVFGFVFTISLELCLFVFFSFFFFLTIQLAGSCCSRQRSGLRLRWESRVQDTGPPENSQSQGILIGESSPRGLISKPRPSSMQMPTGSISECLTLNN